jgi:hypothetical protein
MVMAWAAGCARGRWTFAQRLWQASQSGGRSHAAWANRDRYQLQGGADVVLEAASQHEQAGVLTRVEGVGRAGSGPKAESVGLIVISRTITIKRACS